MEFVGNGSMSTFGYGMPYPRVIPHSDGAGHVDLVGNGVAANWIGRRVWCYGALTTFSRYCVQLE